MDRDLISYVLSISDINLRYNWPDLQKSKFPGLTPKQVSSVDRVVFSRLYLDRLAAFIAQEPLGQQAQELVIPSRGHEVEQRSEE